MTKTTQSAKPKTPFVSAPLPWPWNVCPGVPPRERCLSVGTPKEKGQAVALVAAYREAESLAAVHDIAGLSLQLEQMSRTSRSASAGVPGELLRREIRAADPAQYEAAQARLASLRQEAMDLVAPVLRRLLVSYSESLSQAAIEAEAKLEAHGLPLRNGNSWVLHEDAICCALLSCRVKIEKVLFERQPLSAVGTCQFMLTCEESVPFVWPS